MSTYPPNAGETVDRPKSTLVSAVEKAVAEIEKLHLGPVIKRHRSKQDYATPPEFLAAVEARFGKMSFDLAATHANSTTPFCYTPEVDSLKQDWTTKEGNLWLNPPYDNIAPWAERCAKYASFQRRIFLLTPASVGSNWFARYVHDEAYVLALSPRITFVGQTDPYPRDLILSCYGYGMHGFAPWRWK